ncbi:metal ABC transporter permease [Gracilibacillus saliphilus]|uniref:metal ABC transporter permease n=1 Tax=Gracilibacillus saliphilus TaxID=543890 RepID=UPI0013D8865B|nr:metal ABC transporter permease [Gracilibacillus saliphilus]
MLMNLLEYEFLRNTFFTGIIIGIIAPLLGAFIVVRRLSLIADALSHVTLAGIAFGLLLEKKTGAMLITPFYSGLGFSIIGSVIVERLRRVYTAFQELAIPIILSGGVGLSVIFISVANGFNTDLYNYLFGSVSAVSRQDLYSIIIIAVIVCVVIFFLYKELFLLSFDEEQAVVTGVHAKRIHFIFIVLTALVIAASIRIVGVLLVSALMTLPVAASIRIAKGFKQTIIYAIIYGETAVILGLVSGYYLEIPPGGTIVMLLILLLIATIVTKKVIAKINSRKHRLKTG